MTSRAQMQGCRSRWSCLRLRPGNDRAHVALARAISRRAVSFSCSARPALRAAEWSGSVEYQRSKWSEPEHRRHRDRSACWASVSTGAAEKPSGWQFAWRGKLLLRHRRLRWLDPGRRPGRSRAASTMTACTNEFQAKLSAGKQPHGSRAARPPASITGNRQLTAVQQREEWYVYFPAHRRGMGQSPCSRAGSPAAA